MSGWATGEAEVGEGGQAGEWGRGDGEAATSPTAAGDRGVSLEVEV